MTVVSLAVVLALSSRAEALVRELGSPAFRDREAAQTGLLAIGGPALPAMSKAVGSADPEVARRARGLVKDIGFKIDCARLLAGTPVSLDFTDAPLPVVLTSLSKQSGYALGVAKAVQDPDSVKVTVHTGDVSFWQAAEAVGKAAGLTIAGPGADEGTVRYFVPDGGPAAKTPGDKIRAWAGEVETLLRISQTLDPQARGVLQVYRNDLRHYADGAAAIEKAMAEKKADPNAAASLDRFALQAENIYKAARNLFTAAGVRAPIGPGGRYPVVLGPASGPTGSASAGVWVEPTTAAPAVPQLVKSYALGGGVPPPAVSGPFVHLRVVPEPRIEWVRTTGVRVDHAVDDRGRAVEPNLIAAPFGENANEDIIMLGGGRVVRRPYNPNVAIRPNPFYASVPIKGDALVPTALREFHGVVQGIVRSPAEEVAAGELTVEAKVGPGEPAPHDPLRIRNIAKGNDALPSPAGKPVLTATLKQELVGYSLTVTLQYSTEIYTPASGITAAFNQVVSQNRAQVIRAARGQGAVVVEQTDVFRTSGIKADSFYGLRVTDVAGRPFHLTGRSDAIRLIAERLNAYGTGPMYFQLMLTATATEVSMGPPVRIAWHATRLAAVEVPFDLANVPVVK
jgi:hypothetical protein